MAAEQHAELVRQLTASYADQKELYRQLADVVQRILGQMVLSRGNVAGVMGLFAEKQQLLERITQERERSAEQAQWWASGKDLIPPNNDTARLDAVLEETQNAITSFLEGEEQLKTYLEHLTGRGTQGTQ